MKVLLLLVVLGLIIRTGVSISASIASIDNDGLFEEGALEAPTTMATSMDDDYDIEFVVLLESCKRLFRRINSLESARKMDEGIQSKIQHVKTKLGYYEKDAEELASEIHQLERKMEALRDEEARLQAQCDDLKRGGIIDSCEPYGTDSEELFSTRLALSRVSTQILGLMDEKLKLQESLMEVKQDILKSQYRLQIISNPVSLTAAVEVFEKKLMSRAHSHSHHHQQVDEDIEDWTERKHADLKETQQTEITKYDYADVISIAVIFVEYSVFTVIGIIVVRIFCGKREVLRTRQACY